MTDFQLIVLAIILYSIATTLYIIFLTWQLHKSNKERDKCMRVLDTYAYDGFGNLIIKKLLKEYYNESN